MLTGLPRRIVPRVLTACLLLTSLVLGCFACQGDLEQSIPIVGDPPEEPDALVLTPGQVFANAELAPLVSEGTRVPVDLLITGLPWPHDHVRAVPSLEETADRLENDAEYEELREALRAGGFSDEQITQMVYLAAAHNSGQPADSVRYRHEEVREVFVEAIEQFEAELTALEREHDVDVSREALQELGIFTTANPLPVIP